MGTAPLDERKVNLERMIEHFEATAKHYPATGYETILAQLRQALVMHTYRKKEQV
jgi:hypothetical protein